MNMAQLIHWFVILHRLPLGSLTRRLLTVVS